MPMYARIENAGVRQLVAPELPGADLLPLFKVSRLVAKYYIGFEAEAFKYSQALGKTDTWPVDNSARRDYQNDYNQVAPRRNTFSGGTRPELLEERLETIAHVEGQVFCILYGVNSTDNPLRDVQIKMNTPGEKPKLVVLTASLAERRTQKQIDADTTLGRYHVSASIGTPEGWDAVYGVVNQLHDTGIIRAPFALTQLSRLVGAVAGFPLSTERLTDLLHKLVTANKYISSADIQEAQRLEQELLHDMDPVDLSQVILAYKRWLGSNFIALTNPDKISHLYGEIGWATEEDFDLPNGLMQGTISLTDATIGVDFTPHDDSPAVRGHFYIELQSLRRK